MFKLKIGDIEIQKYLTDFSFGSASRSTQKSRNASGGFECYDGTVISSDGRVIPPEEASSEIITLNISLKKVPSGEAETIRGAVSESTFDVECPSPAISGSYKKTSYNSSSRTKGIEWDIDMVLESAAADDTSASGSL